MIDAAATTSLPVNRQRVTVNVDSVAAGRSVDDDDEDDEDYHDEMTSFGSGYYDNDDDDADGAMRDYGDTASAHAHNHDPIHDVWPPGLPSSSSSSGSRPGFHVDDVDSRLDDRQQQTADVDLTDVSRTLSTTPAATRTRLKTFSPTRRGSLERRRPDSLVTSSSSAARRRYYVDNMAATSGAAATATATDLFTTFYALHCVLFCSARVFLRLPVIRAPSLC